MYSLEVKSAKKSYVQAQNADVIEVEVLVIQKATEEEKEDTPVETRFLSFPLDTDKEVMRAELAKFIATYNSDAELAVQNKELEEDHKTADETIADIQGLKL